MALGIADQDRAARLAGAVVGALQLDAVWTAGMTAFIDQGEHDPVAARNLGDVAERLAQRLTELSRETGFLLQFSDEFDVLLADRELPEAHGVTISAAEFPVLLRQAVVVVDRHAESEAGQLHENARVLRGFGETGGLRYMESDLPARFRAAVEMIAAALCCGLSLCFGVMDGGLSLGVGLVFLADALRLLDEKHPGV